GAVTMPAGSSFSVPITVTPTVAGSLVNPRSGGACAADPNDVIPESNERNNSCTPNPVTVTPVADLSITKTDNATEAVPGTAITYPLVAGNAGPSAVTGATVTDTVPAAITGVTWSCGGAGGASCPSPANGSGDINVLVNLPVGGTAT